MTDSIQYQEYFDAIKAILKSPTKSIKEEELKKILGNPPNSTWHKHKKRLVETIGILKREANPVPEEVHDPETGKVKIINKHIYVLEGGYNNLYGLALEEVYALEAYKHIGSLMDTHLADISMKEKVNQKDLDQLQRKFFYLSKVQAKALSGDHQKYFKIIMNALLNNKQLLMNYSSDEGKKTRALQPLCISMHRDDLYLMAKEEVPHESGSGFYWKRKSYKISRILKVVETANIFKYPSKNDWNPEKEFSNSAGIISGTPAKAIIRAKSHLLTVIKEKHFFNAKMAPDHGDEEVFEISYAEEGVDELLGQLAIYCQCLEIIEPVGLREKFYEKLKAGMDLNPSSDKVKKAS